MLSITLRFKDAEKNRTGDEYFARITEIQYSNRYERISIQYR
jgi:hypothetical protein